MGLNREMKMQESSSREVLCPREVCGPGLCFLLDPGTGRLCSCHLPSGSQSKERVRMHDLQPSVTWSLFFAISESSRSMHDLVWFVCLFACFWLLTLPVSPGV